MKITEVENFHAVDVNVFRGALPSAQGMQQLCDFGIRTIINLCSSGPSVKYVEIPGIRYEYIPMGAKSPTRMWVDRLLEILRRIECYPVFFHCYLGVDRSGFVTALYRVVFQGWSKPDALYEMLRGPNRSNLFSMAFAEMDFGE